MTDRPDNKIFVTRPAGLKFLYLKGNTAAGMEVNVLCAKAVDPATTPQMIYQNGESLQQYFAGEGFLFDV